jgi:hypothetical protein
VLKPGGVLILNASDFIRRGERFPITDRHIELVEGVGFEVVDRVVVTIARMRRGENHKSRGDGEDIVVLRRSGSDETCGQEEFGANKNPQASDLGVLLCGRRDSNPHGHLPTRT